MKIRIIGIGIVIFSMFGLTSLQVHAYAGQCSSIFETPQLRYSNDPWSDFVRNQNNQIKFPLAKLLKAKDRNKMTSDQIERLERGSLTVEIQYLRVYIAISDAAGNNIGHLIANIEKGNDSPIHAKIDHMAIGSNIDPGGTEEDRGIGLGSIMFEKLIEVIGTHAVLSTYLAADNATALYTAYERSLEKGRAEYHPEFTQDERLRFALLQTPAYKMRRAFGIGKILKVVGPSSDEAPYYGMEFDVTGDD